MMPGSRGTDDTADCQANRPRNCGLRQDIYLHYNARTSGQCSGHTIHETCGIDESVCICKVPPPWTPPPPTHPPLLPPPYIVVRSGTCDGAGYAYITSAAECAAAGTELGYTDGVNMMPGSRGTDDTADCQANRPRNCGLRQDIYLHYNARTSGQCSGHTIHETCGIDESVCICKVPCVTVPDPAAETTAGSVAYPNNRQLSSNIDDARVVVLTAVQLGGKSVLNGGTAVARVVEGSGATTATKHYYAAYLDASYLKMVRLTVSLGSALTLTQDGARYRSAAGSYVTSAGGDLDAVDVEGAYTGSGYSTMAVAYSSGANGYGAASVTYSITGLCPLPPSSPPSLPPPPPAPPAQCVGSPSSWRFFTIESTTLAATVAQQYVRVRARPMTAHGNHTL